MTKPEALRLADALEMSSNHGIRREAAAELRRLHAQRDALLEALKEISAMWDHHCYAHGDGQPTPLHIKARAAIKAAEENA